MAGRALRVGRRLPVVLFPMFGALFIFAVLVVQVAASSAGNTAEGGSGEGILIEDDSSGDTGGRADGRTGGEMLFLGAAGGEGKGKDGYGESRKDSVHVFLVVAARAMRASRAEPVFFACAILIQEGA